MPKNGEFKKLRELFESVYLLKDPYVLKTLVANVISQRLASDPVWIVIVGPSGGGKCLGKGTRIMMYDGSVKLVEDIKTGDLVMGDDSRPKTVLSTNRGKEKLFRIHQARGDSYVVNYSHILSLQQSNSAINYKGYQKNSIIDIPLKEYQRKSENFKKTFKGFKVPVDFKVKPILLDPYFLGVWLGDGRRNYPSITSADKEIVNFLHDFSLENNLKISTKSYGGLAQAYLIVNKTRNRMIKNPICEKLKYYGLIPKKFIPQDYKINSREIRLQVLAGLIDTDGTLSISSGFNRKKTHKSFDFISKDEQLSKDVVFLARSVGLHASLRKRIIKLPNKKETRPYWKVYIGGNIEIIPTKIKRKIAVQRERTTNSLLSTITVEPLGIGEYFGFTLDGNGRFLLEDCTVTHNSEMINSIAKCAGVFPLSTLTSKTFISGQRGEKTSSLLMQMHNGIITFKDMTSLLSEHKDERAIIMAQLREIYDGKYSKSFGTGETINWQGKITVIAGATYAIHTLKQAYTAMGERFLFYNMIQPERIDAARKTMENQEEGNMNEKRAGLQDAMALYINETIEMPPQLPHISKALQGRVLQLAELATRSRSDVERNWRSPQQEIAEVHPPEMPTRFAGQLQTMAISLIIINWNETGEAILLPEDETILNKLALDSITKSRRIAMQELCKYDTITTAGLATKLSLPTTSVRRWLEDITALEIATRTKGSGPQGDTWRITDHYKKIIEQFEHIKIEGDSLRGDEDMPEEESDDKAVIPEELKKVARGEIKVEDLQL